jgi:hypothetical protein
LGGITATALSILRAAFRKDYGTILGLSLKVRLPAVAWYFADIMCSFFALLSQKYTRRIEHHRQAKVLNSKVFVLSASE